MPARIITELSVCACCASLSANGDESSCLHYWQHAPHALSSIELDAGQRLVIGDCDESFSPYNYWECDGCGQAQLPGAEEWSAVILGTVREHLAAA